MLADTVGADVDAAGADLAAEEAAGNDADIAPAGGGVGAAAAAGAAGAGAAALDVLEAFTWPPWPLQAPRPVAAEVVPSLQAVGPAAAGADAVGAGAAGAAAGAAAVAALALPP